MTTDTGPSLIEQWLAAGDAGDLDRFDDVLHADVVVHAPAGLSTRGVEAEKEVWRTARSALPGLHHDVREVIAQGSTIMARAVVTGRFESQLGGLSPTGKQFRIDQAVVVHVAGGKIVEAWEIADLLPLSAVSGSEEP